MKQRYSRLIFLAALLLVVSLACSLTGSGEQEANQVDVSGRNEIQENNQDAQQDVDQDQEEQSAGEGDELPVGADVISFADVDVITPMNGVSFYMRMVYSFNSETVSEAYELNGAFNAGPPEEATYTVVYDGVEGVNSITIADLAAGNFTYVPGYGCVQYSDTEIDSLYDDMLFEGDDLFGTATLVERGVEVNGVITDRYALNPDNFTGIDAEGVTFEKGDLYLSREGYVIYLEVVGSGSNMFGDTAAEGTFTFTFSIEPTTSAIEISLPEQCAGQ